MNMKKLTATLTAAGTLLATGLGLALPGTAASTDGHHRFGVKEFEGRVLRVNRERGVFVQSVRFDRHGWHSHRDRGNSHKGKLRLRIKVTGRTRYDDLAGFGALRRGMKVETLARPLRAKRHGNKHKGWRIWVALKVDRDARKDRD